MHKQTIKCKQVIEAKASKTTQDKRKAKMEKIIAEKVNED